MELYSLNHLFMQVPVAICIVSGEDYKVELANERMLEFLGRTPDVVGQPIESTLTEAKKQGLIAILDAVNKTKQPYYASAFPAVILINGVRELRYFNLVFKPYYLHPGDSEPAGIFCVAHNITGQVLTNQQLEEEKKRTALALEVGELGMISTDWKNNTVNADKRAREIFEITESNSIEEYASHIHPDDKKLREKILEEAYATGNFDFEFRLVFNGQPLKWIRSRGVLQKDFEGNFTGSFGVVQDITVQKEFSLALHKKVEERTKELEIANKSLLDVNEELKHSNAALEEFTRVASHDLKEPIRKIYFFSDRLKALLTQRLSADEKNLFEKIEHGAERMKLLVDDLLEYSHLDQAVYELEEIDLNTKINLILSDLELMIREKNAGFHIDVLPTIKGFRRQLQQLFQNLITNALKYNKPGTNPEIRIGYQKIKAGDTGIAFPELTASQQFHKIEVCDNGIGFEQAEAERIFNVFTRLHGNKDYPGTGIGLSIAKKVMDNHHGFIYAKSEPGEGSCFTLLFPVEE